MANRLLGPSWSQQLHKARSRPWLFGCGKNRHLFLVVSEPLWSIYKARVFRRPDLTTLTLSQQQYRLVLRSGPLRPEITELIECEQSDILMADVGRAVVRLQDGPAEWKWAACLRTPRHAMQLADSPVFLARAGFLGIRTESGFWCQAYHRGWPITPVVREDTAPAEVGLVAFGSLTKDLFTGLPYQLAEVDAAVPDCARGHVRTEWRDPDIVDVPAVVSEALEERSSLSRLFLE